MTQALPSEYVTAYEVVRLDAATGEWLAEATIPCKLEIEVKEVRLLWVFKIKQQIVRDYRESVLQARRAAYHQMRVNDNNNPATRRIIQISLCDGYREWRCAA